MVKSLFLLAFFLMGCSSHKLSRHELLKLSVFHKVIPTENKDTAREFLNQQRKYLTLLYENYPTSPMPEACRENKLIGEVRETKGQLALVSLLKVDHYGKPNTCSLYDHDARVWDVYFYCHGDSGITNMKIRSIHMPELKDISLCE